VRVEAVGEMPNRTEVVYYGANLKGSFDWLLSWIVGVRADAISLSADQEVGGDRYRIYLGADYDPCRPHLESPLLGREP
jgi:hypothetical protein